MKKYPGRVFCKKMIWWLVVATFASAAPLTKENLARLDRAVGRANNSPSNVTLPVSLNSAFHSIKSSRSRSSSVGTVLKASSTSQADTVPDKDDFFGYYVSEEESTGDQGLGQNESADDGEDKRIESESETNEKFNVAFNRDFEDDLLASFTRYYTENMNRIHTVLIVIILGHFIARMFRK